MKSHQMINALRPAYRRTWKTWERLKLLTRRGHPIIVQGIQRSGTNYLSQLLMASEYRVLNQADPPRDNPRHKHFRWLEDKSLISMDERYQNRTTAHSIHEVNRLSGWPADSRHVVIFRDPEGWLNAIFRWGLENSWYSSEAEFVDLGRNVDFMAEWHAYYAQWQAFAEADPQLVYIVAFQNLRSNPSEVLAAIDEFAGIERPSGRPKVETVGTVRHSKPLNAPRQKLMMAESIAIAAQPGAFDWRRFAALNTQITETIQQ